MLSPVVYIYIYIYIYIIYFSEFLGELQVNDVTLDILAISPIKMGYLSNLFTVSLEMLQYNHHLIFPLNALIAADSTSVAFTS